MWYLFIFSQKSSISRAFLSLLVDMAFLWSDFSLTLRTSFSVSNSSDLLVNSLCFCYPNIFLFHHSQGHMSFPMPMSVPLLQCKHLNSPKLRPLTCELGKIAHPFKLYDHLLQYKMAFGKNLVQSGLYFMSFPSLKDYNVFLSLVQYSYTFIGVFGSREILPLCHV